MASKKEPAAEETAESETFGTSGTTEASAGPVHGRTVNPGNDSALNQAGYAGVDPIYQNAANSSEEPF